MKVDSQFQAVRQIVAEGHNSYDFTLNTICQKMEISRVTLHRIVKRNTGLSVSKYINSIRLESAFNLLSEFQISVKEVATKVGYQDAKYFSRLFKNRYGKVPSKW